MTDCRTEIAKVLYGMNGRQWYGRDLGDWDDPDSRIGRNEYERSRWLWQAEQLVFVVAEAEQRALREAADEAEALRSFAHGKNPTSKAHLIGYGTARRVIVRLLRDRADEIGTP